MARVVVDVMLKPEIADPQGRAIVGAAHRLGFPQVSGVRQGKRFEIEVAGPIDEAELGKIREMAGTLLANPVIETYEIRIFEEPAADAR